MKTSNQRRIERLQNEREQKRRDVTIYSHNVLTSDLRNAFNAVRSCVNLTLQIVEAENHKVYPLEVKIQWEIIKARRALGQKYDH